MPKAARADPLDHAKVNVVLASCHRPMARRVIVKTGEEAKSRPLIKNSQVDRAPRFTHVETFAYVVDPGFCFGHSKDLCVLV